MLFADARKMVEEIFRSQGSKAVVGLAMDSAFHAKAIALGFSSPGKYGDIERERRWLCGDFPKAEATRILLIRDLYVADSSLRLRSMQDAASGETAWKLSRKGDLSPDRRVITTLYLTKAEYDLMAGFPGRPIHKSRYRLAVHDGTFSVDVFEGALAGLVMAEAEFADDDVMAAFVPPAFVGREVTDDVRYTGGRLCLSGIPLPLPSA
jgi:CYTH domain-containing protein